MFRSVHEDDTVRDHECGSCKSCMPATSYLFDELQTIGRHDSTTRTITELLES